MSWERDLEGELSALQTSKDAARIGVVGQELDAAAACIAAMKKAIAAANQATTEDATSAATVQAFAKIAGST